jgi:hypothetical protein
VRDATYPREARTLFERYARRAEPFVVRSEGVISARARWRDQVSFPGWQRSSEWTRLCSREWNLSAIAFTARGVISQRRMLRVSERVAHNGTVTPLKVPQYPLAHENSGGRRRAWCVGSPSCSGSSRGLRGSPSR